VYKATAAELGTCLAARQSTKSHLASVRKSAAALASALREGDERGNKKRQQPQSNRALMDIKPSPRK